jgi:hypothetical protein
MNMHVSPDQRHRATKADAIRSILRDRPGLRNAEVAELAGSTETYVRVVRQRRNARTSEGRLQAALNIAVQCYQASLEARAACELDHDNRDLGAAYQEAWDMHKAAEKVYLGLTKPAGELRPRVERPRGVNVRDLLERQGAWPRRDSAV